MKLAHKTKSINYGFFTKWHNMETNHTNPIIMSKTNHDAIYSHYPFHYPIMPHHLHMPTEPTIGSSTSDWCQGSRHNLCRIHYIWGNNISWEVIWVGSQFCSHEIDNFKILEILAKCKTKQCIYQMECKDLLTNARMLCNLPNMFVFIREGCSMKYTFHLWWVEFLYTMKRKWHWIWTNQPPMSQGGNCFSYMHE